MIVPSVTHVNSVSVTDIGTDYLTVQVESGEDSGAFDVTCSDAYGNQSRKAFTAGEAMTFDSLVPGTQYTIEAVPLEGKKMTGSYSATASTYAETKILSFTATPISITQAELNFILQDGPDFDSWTLSYAAEGAEAKTVTFSGHSVVISDLQSGSEYTFTLLPRKYPADRRDRRDAFDGADRGSGARQRIHRDVQLLRSAYVAV